MIKFPADAPDLWEVAIVPEPTLYALAHAYIASIDYDEEHPECATSEWSVELAHDELVAKAKTLNPDENERHHSGFTADEMWGAIVHIAALDPVRAELSALDAEAEAAGYPGDPRGGLDPWLDAVQRAMGQPVPGDPWEELSSVLGIPRG